MKRTIAIISAIAVVAIGFLVLFGYQALQTIVARPKFLAVRECTLTPQPLSLSAEQADAGGTQLSQFGYTITVPWTDKQQAYGAGNVTNVMFSGGQRVTLFDPEETPDILDMLVGHQRPGMEAESEELNRVFGTIGHEEFYKRLLYSHPSGFSLFMGRREAKQLKLCLMMKVGLLTDDSAVYSFAYGELRGFQLGDPRRDARCGVLLFNGADVPVRFIVGRENGTKTIITQHDIVQIIKSFHRVRDKPNTNR